MSIPRLHTLMLAAGPSRESAAGCSRSGETASAGPTNHRFALALAILCCAALLVLPQGLQIPGRVTLCVFALAIIGWTMTDLNDAQVALGAATLLCLLGVLEPEALMRTLAHEMIWLLIASFVVAGAITATGAAETLVLKALRVTGTVRQLLFALTLIIVATAFIIPSTTARAALFLPVFLALRRTLPDGRLVKPIALLIPTAILLSACASLVGAGAHMIAVEHIARATGERMSFISWTLLGLPFALASCVAATYLLLRIFVPGDLQCARMTLSQERGPPVTVHQTLVSLIAIVILLSWVTAPLHGLSLVVTALVGATLLLSPAITGVTTKALFKSVELELIIFLAATFAMAAAMTSTGADRWLASALLVFFDKNGLLSSGAFAMLITAAVALSAHILINSRTARASILIPAFAMPLSAFGHDARTLIIITVFGTGFCQTMMASAKPVALYGNIDGETYSAADLRKLSLALLPVMLVLLMSLAAITH